MAGPVPNYTGKPKKLVLKSESPPTYVLRLVAGTEHAIVSGKKSNFRKYATSDPTVARAEFSGDEGRVTISAHGEGTCALTFEGEAVRFNVGLPAIPKRPAKGNLPAGTPPSSVTMQPDGWLTYTNEVTVDAKASATTPPPKPPKSPKPAPKGPKRSKAAGRVDKLQLSGEYEKALKALDEAEELEGADEEAQRIAALRRTIKAAIRKHS